MTTSTAKTPDASAAPAPRTEEVLRLIGDDGVIVGSFAELGHSTKDVDVVVPQNPDTEGPTSLVIQRVYQRYAPYCESDAVGHLWVHALPLPVELFATKAWRTGDPEKDRKRLEYRQARRKCQRRTVLGVEMQVYAPPAR